MVLLHRGEEIICLVHSGLPLLLVVDKEGLEVDIALLPGQVVDIEVIITNKRIFRDHPKGILGNMARIGRGV